MSICYCENCNEVIDLDYENVSVSDDGMNFICQKCNEEEEE